MGLFVKKTEEKKLVLSGTEIELDEIYGRVRFLASPDGKGIEFETMYWYNKSKFVSGAQPIQVDVQFKAQRVILPEGQKQDLETVLSHAKSYVEQLGYDCEIEDSEDEQG